MRALGVDGKYRTLVVAKYILPVIFALLLPVQDVMAQTGRGRVSASDELRARAQQRKPVRNPYWDGFILKLEGNCADAQDKLRPIARQGFGYEEAQTALGECLIYLAGLNPSRETLPSRQEIAQKPEFQEGIGWLEMAANANSFTAQGILIALYAANLGPTEDPIEAAKWAHLYLSNPVRLNLGVPVLAQVSIDTLRDGMDKQSWLEGKEKARAWVPAFTPPQSAGKTATEQKIAR